MAAIHLDYLKPGMLLGSDVKDLNGMLLAKAGSALTEKHLYIFRAWGITEADIRDVTQEQVRSSDTADVDPRVLRGAEVALRELFRHTDETHPAIQELLRVCALRAVRYESGKR